LRAAGSLLILEGVLIDLPLIVLGSTIGWPASLGDPPSQSRGWCCISGF
jgi:hypothetical protein